MGERVDKAAAQSRRERAYEQKRRRIAAAAGALFQQNGFEATTTDQIAAHADVAKGTLFLYAPTKARLLVLVFETELDTAVAEAFAEVDPNGAPVETLLRIFGRLLDVYERDLDLSRRFVQEALFIGAHDPPYSAALETFYARLGELIAGWQASGKLLPDAPPPIIAATTFAIYFATLLGRLRGAFPDAASRDAMLAAGLSLHFRGLRSDN